MGNRFLWAVLPAIAVNVVPLHISRTKLPVLWWMMLQNRELHLDRLLRLFPRSNFTVFNHLYLILEQCVGNSWSIWIPLALWIWQSSKGLLSFSGCVIILWTFTLRMIMRWKRYIWRPQSTFFNNSNEGTLFESKQFSRNLQRIWTTYPTTANTVLVFSLSQACQNVRNERKDGNGFRCCSL